MLNPTMIRVLNGAAAPNPTEDPDFFNMCRLFADYQKNPARFYKNDYRSFSREGFMVGSAWHGDALNATVLFIGSNPGLTKGCLFPRLHPDGSLTLGGLDAPAVMNGDNGSVYNNSITYDKAKDFITSRFQHTKINPDNGYLNAYVLRQDGRLVGKPGGVAYWRGMYDVMKALRKDYPDGNPAAHGRKLMARVLSTEVVPFGSANEKPFSRKNMTAFHLNKAKALTYCRDKFIVPLMNNSAVKIVFLVGKISQEVFRQPGKTYQDRYGENLVFATTKHLSAMGEPDYPNAVKALHALGPALPKV